MNVAVFATSSLPPLLIVHVASKMLLGEALTGLSAAPSAISIAPEPWTSVLAMRKLFVPLIVSLFVPRFRYALSSFCAMMPHAKSAFTVASAARVMFVTNGLLFSSTISLSEQYTAPELLMPVPAMDSECASRELTRSTAPPDATAIDVLSNRPFTANATPLDTVTDEVAILPEPASVSLPLPVTASDPYSTSDETMSVESSWMFITTAPLPDADGDTSSALAAQATPRASVDKATALISAVNRKMILFIMMPLLLKLAHFTSLSTPSEAKGYSCGVLYQKSAAGCTALGAAGAATNALRWK